jgi:hypothetical protein
MAAASTSFGAETVYLRSRETPRLKKVRSHQPAISSIVCELTYNLSIYIAPIPRRTPGSTATVFDVVRRSGALDAGWHVSVGLDNCCRITGALLALGSSFFSAP